MHGRKAEPEVAFRNRILPDKRSAWRDLLQLFHFRELPCFPWFLMNKSF